MKLSKGDGNDDGKDASPADTDQKEAISVTSDDPLFEYFETGRTRQPSTDSEESGVAPTEKNATQQPQPAVPLASSTPERKKYQPDRSDMLWNTDWGIAEELISKEEGERKGFRLYKRRWVTKEERRILSGQRRAYMAIRATATIIVAYGMLPLMLLIPALRRGQAEDIVAAALGILLAGFFWLVGIHLYKFKPWARIVTSIFFVCGLLIYGPTTEPASFHGPACGLVTALFLYFLWNAQARKIFSGGTEPLSKPEPTGWPKPPTAI